MKIILDVFVFVALVFAVFQGLRRNLLRCLVSYVTLFLVAAMVTVVSVPVSSFTAGLVVPGQERKAANQLADMFSAPHQKDGMDTVKELDLRKLILERPAGFTDLCGRYHVDMDDLAVYLESFNESDTAAFNQQVLKDIVTPYSKTAGYIYTFLFLFLLLSVLVRVLYMRYGSFKYPRKENKAMCVVLSLLTCVLYLSIAALLLNLAAPYLTGSNSAAFPQGFVQDTVLFQFFSQYNIWGWLLK